MNEILLTTTVSIIHTLVVIGLLVWNQNKMKEILNSHEDKMEEVVNKQVEKIDEHIDILGGK